MRAVVVSGGDLASSDLDALDGADLVVAADGGLRALLAKGIQPQVVIGDMDSIDAEVLSQLADRGTQVERHPADKEASDTELAVERSLAVGADEVTLVGALGGPRLDHAMANVLLITAAGMGGVTITYGGSRARTVRGGERLALQGGVGDLVSVLPVGADATGVSTHGLRWPLDAATLHAGRSRGVSNELTDVPAWVEVARGTLLVIETRNEART